MLGIGLIYTSEGKAQAKGKVEKSFDYLQRRIPYLCERHKVKTVKEANKILEEVLWFYKDGTKSFTGKRYKVGCYPGAESNYLPHSKS